MTRSLDGRFDDPGAQLVVHDVGVVGVDGEVDVWGLAEVCECVVEPGEKGLEAVVVGNGIGREGGRRGGKRRGEDGERRREKRERLLISYLRTILYTPLVPNISGVHLPKKNNLSMSETVFHGVFKSRTRIAPPTWPAANDRERRRECVFGSVYCTDQKTSTGSRFRKGFSPWHSSLYRSC